VIFLNTTYLDNCPPVLKDEWRGTAISPPMVVIDDLLCPEKKQEIFESFPSDLWPEWDNISDSLQSKKMSCERIQVFPHSLSVLMHELNSGPALRFLEKLTGVEGLIPDCHLWGGGLHLMQPGGYLWPHTDFLQGESPNLMRVINLILYLHSEWRSEMGGYFQVWDGASLVRNILPEPGRCVIFKTDAHSIHGVSRVKGVLPRKSIALFYYTVTEKQRIVLDHTTGWRLSLSPEDSKVSTLRRVAAGALMKASFGLKRSAVALNAKAEEIANSRRS
jgi:Rps23 Pro-64 3,4-dihydroxylase Tpa1-like proline 4-hydroxylase